MANFDEFIQKTAVKAGVIADKSVVIAKKAAEGAKDAVRIAKVNVDMAAERDAMREGYIKLGKLYYELHKDDPEEAVAEIVNSILESEQKIARLRAEIADDTDDTVEAEYTVSDDEASESDMEKEPSEE